MYEKLNDLHKLIYDERKKKCDECVRFEDCTQDLQGQAPTIIYDSVFDKCTIGSKRCSKVKGVCNSNLIELAKYDKVECHNFNELLENFKINKQIYIYSKAGLGKTHYLFYLAKRYVAQGKNVYINHMQQILNDIKSSWNKDNRISQQNQETIIKRLQEVDVLFIDDLGSELASEWSVLDVLQSIIDYRYINEKPTIVSSNHSPRALGNIYARKVYINQIEHIISRLEDLGAVEYKAKYWRNINRGSE